MTFMDRLSDRLGAVAQVVSGQKHIAAIKNAFTVLMPFIITGAFATMLKSVVFDPSTGLAKYEAIAFLAKLQPIAGAVQFATLNFMTFGAIILIGYELGKSNGFDSALPGVLALSCFVTVIPTFVMVTQGAETIQVLNVIARDFMDAKSLFLGMIVALTSVEMYSKLMSIERLKVKMPDTVPPNVSNAFSALFPVILTICFYGVFGFAFKTLTGIYIHELIYSVVQRPLEGIMQGLPGALALMFVAQVFWIIGVHGGQMIKPIRDPILLAAITANASGAKNIINQPFWDMYMVMGGSGLTIGLMIAIFLVSKRSDYRAVAKLSIMPGLFNINETLIFGLPIMLNPILAIPFICAPLITGTIGYFATKWGFAAIATVAIPWTTPPILSGFLATNGNMGAVITQVICIIVATLVYVPFVMIANKQKTN